MLQYLRRIPPYIPTLLVFVAICYLSLDADPFHDNRRFFVFPGSDKVVHFIMYAGLTATFCFDYYRRHTQHRLSWLFIALVAAVATGAVLELLQTHMGMGRTGDYIDFIANSLGAVAGMVAGSKIFSRLFAS